MSSSDLPDILKVGPLKRPVNQSCSTDILQPTTFSQKGMKFVLEKKGILDSNSQLNIAQIVVDSGKPTIDTRSYLPTATGALAMIDRAYLTIGGREISDLRDVGHYNTWKRLHYSNEYRKGVAQPHQGGNDVMMGSAGLPSGTTTATDKRARGFSAPYGVIGRESSEYGNNFNTSDTTYGRQVNSSVDTTEKPKRQITRDPTTTPSFLIALSQLCPVLVGFQLPLFAINQEVALHIEFTPNTIGHRFMYNVSDGQTPPVANNPATMTSTIVEEECFLVMDTLFYRDLMSDVQEQIMSRGGYSVPYDDVITQRNYITYNVADGETTHDLQIPLSQRRVKRIVVQQQNDLEAVILTRPSGYYNSQALRTGVEYNFRIDSKNVYSLPMRNVALQRAEADLVEGIPLVLNSSVYSFSNQADQTTGVMTLPNDSNITPRLLNSHIQSNETGLQGWFGLKIENQFGQGHKMGIQPVIFTQKGTATANDDGTGNPTTSTSRQVRFFSLYQRIMNITGGLVEVID
tara:strand:- start:76 stop:1626 length:1551 start_codon:yes stop_codon:yes gene_type:complete